MDNIYLENEVEKLKITIAKRSDFTDKEAYRAFDPHHREQMNLDEFIEASLNFVGLQGF